MQVEFKDERLGEVFRTRSHGRHFSVQVARAFLRRMDVIVAASGEHDLRAARALRFHALEGNRAGTFGIDLNGNDRLIVSIDKSNKKSHVVVVHEITDYH